MTKGCINTDLVLSVASGTTVASHDLAVTVAAGMALQAGAEGVAPEWVQLMPAGTFKARDGRGPFRLTDPAAVVAATKAAIEDAAGALPIDYDHAAECKELGAPAPAAGWIEEVQARDDGIWARVAWTQKAASAVAGREYRFISPVFYHDRKTGQIASIIRAGLTNTPAFKMAALAASQQQEELMTPEQIQALRDALGLKDDASADAIVAAATQQGQATTAASEQLGRIRTALGVDDKADLVAAATAAKAGAAAEAGDTEIDKLQMEIASLRAERATEKAVAAVDEAVKAGKLAPAQRDWAVGYASRDPDGFAGFVEKAPAVLGKGAPEGSPAGTGGAAGGSAVAICRQLGISVDDFNKTAAANKAAAETGSAA